MAKRRAKKTIKEQHSTLERDSNNTQEELPAPVEKQLCTFSNHEVERRITAIQAIRDAEIEHLLTQLRLLRSYFSKEQLETPALQFFAKNLPSLSVVKNEEDGQFELEWKSKDNNPPISYDDERNGCASFMQRTSIGYPDCSDAFPAISGFQFSSEAVKTNFLEAASLHIQDFGLEELSQTQMLGFQDAFQTPGVNSQRLSVGVTPKTLRLPKNGEMLLSVRGSPLGVYREEDNMEAIHESEEG
ncbi:uncharacterized protein LOC131222359 [Magnolia sinica]|uniref:uncharacterized protein LOC131222359 n=1 Tax=Magnolia sinica TaxID=86752 RepID=UPI002658E71D|nr:uncharacterized protein LOC131222359 [Magnolia sinica]